ncbi:hypothetical protein T12_16683, partial [Trichinella patagoniensis]
LKDVKKRGENVNPYENPSGRWDGREAARSPEESKEPRGKETVSRRRFQRRRFH